MSDINIVDEVEKLGFRVEYNHSAYSVKAFKVFEFSGKDKDYIFYGYCDKKDLKELLSKRGI